MKAQTTVILGLGSNSGDREDYLRQATGLLSGLLAGMRASAVHETKALLPEGAPKEWDKPFLNMAVLGKTEMPPRQMLTALKAIEEKIGRKPSGKWGPREIDIDILAMGDVVMDTPSLSIPHPELLNRDFALLPLVELAPQWVYPGSGKYHGWKSSDIAADLGFGMPVHPTGKIARG